MIKDIMNANESVLPNSKTIEILKEKIFHTTLIEMENLILKRFANAIKDEVKIDHEGYELKFLGKNYARLLESIDTTTVIVPDEKHNEKPENKESRNLYLSGDNLDALKHLEKSLCGPDKVHLY